MRYATTGAFHVDQLEMYHVKQRQSYISTAVVELGCKASVIKREVGRLLLLLEQKQNEARQGVEQYAPSVMALSAKYESAALELLKSPELAERIVSDLASCGVVGESANLLTGYMAAT